jgi:general nucleoside transport system permease protein
MNFEIFGLTFTTAIIIALLNATIRQSIPITLGAMSGIFSERSSIVNIGIEGMMLMGAFVGFMVNVNLSDPVYANSNSWLAQDNVRLGLSVVAGVSAGGAMGLIHALLCIYYKVDHIISGTVINIFAVGITGYFYNSNSQTQGKIPLLIKNPWNSDDPLFNVGRVLFDKSLITYLTFIVIAASTFALYKTVWGLRTRSIGENPRAADTLGINVYQLQYTNLLISGMLAGLAGAYLSLDDVGTFERSMTAGKGFIALAVMIFGKWNPVGAMLASLFFGFLIAFQSQLQFLGVNIPHQLVSIFPYAATVIVLAGFVGRSRPPAHVGRSYEVEGH